MTTDRVSTDTVVVKTWHRQGPIPAIMARLARLAERGALHGAIYTFFGIWSVCAAFAILRVLNLLPDGTSTQAISRFFSDYHTPSTVTVMILPFIVAIMLVLTGLISAELYRADTSPGHRLSWIGFASDLGFTVYFSFEVGLYAATNLLAGKIDDGIIHGLHVAAFTSAYILGGLWLPFLICFLIISRQSRLFPTWINWLAFINIFANGGAWLAALTLSGPFNGQNGIIGVGLPFIGPAIFYIMLLAHFIADEFAIAVIRINHLLTSEAQPQQQR